MKIDPASNEIISLAPDETMNEPQPHTLDHQNKYKGYIKMKDINQGTKTNTIYFLLVMKHNIVRAIILVI